MHYFVCFKNEEKKRENKFYSYLKKCYLVLVLYQSTKFTPTSNNNNYINDCLNYFPQGIYYKEYLIFYRLY